MKHSQPPNNILLIQLGDIGDVVLTTPTIRAAKESYPGARVSILVRKPYGGLLENDPAIHQVIESERVRGSLGHRLQEYLAFAHRLRQASFDLVVDLRTGDQGAILAFLTRAPVRVGCHGTRKQFWHDFLFTLVIHKLKAAPPPVHPGADQSLRVVREIGITTSDTIPKLYVSSEDEASVRALLAQVGIAPDAGMVTVNPFSRWKYKEWSNEKWGLVVDRIWDDYKLPAVLIGSAQEAAGCLEIIKGREGRAFSVAGMTSLGELSAVISMSRLHLGVDSAAPHIAAALGIPTITIHGPSNWRGWRIADALNKIVTPDMECVPCNQMGCEGSGTSECLENLGIEPVIRKAIEVLEESALSNDQLVDS